MESRVSYEKRYELLIYAAIVGIIAVSLLKLKKLEVIDGATLQNFAVYD